MNHRINWSASNIIYKHNNVGMRRVVEDALICLLKTFDNNKSFTQESISINKLVCLGAKINLDLFF